MHHLSDLLEELLEELARYEGRHRSFDASRLVRIVAELLARALSLSNPDPGRVPDRLVAGSPAKETRVARSRLVGLGTEFLETDADCRMVAHLVDARSGVPMRVTRRITDEQGTNPMWSTTLPPIRNTNAYKVRPSVANSTAYTNVFCAPVAPQPVPLSGETPTNSSVRPAS